MPAMSVRACVGVPPAMKSFKPQVPASRSSFKKQLELAPGVELCGVAELGLHHLLPALHLRSTKVLPEASCRVTKG